MRRLNAPVVDERVRSRRNEGARWLPLRILGWIAGALSVVNLMRDLDWVSLRGTLGRWVEVYERLVTDAVDFLFGWISVSWIEMTEPEAHLIVICSLLASSVARGFALADFYESLGAWFGAIALFVGVPVLVALLTPGPWGVWLVAACLAIICLVLFLSEGEGYNRRRALLNIVGALGFVVLIVLGASLFGI
jgi:hypothetical protein